MVPSQFIVRHSLILTWIIIFIETLPKDISKRVEVFVIFIVIVLLGLVRTWLQCFAFITLVDISVQVWNNISLQINALKDVTYLWLILVVHFEFFTSLFLFLFELLHLTGWFVFVFCFFVVFIMALTIWCLVKQILVYFAFILLSHKFLLVCRSSTRLNSGACKSLLQLLYRVPLLFLL